MNNVLAFDQPAGSTVISDGNTDTFMHDVMEASLQTPVIVDFWAPWCGPCKTLTPLLEKHVQAQGGRVKLVKIDIDQNQQLAAQFRIQSVPTVFAFFQGQPVHAFQGSVPESQLKQFVDRLAKLAKGGVDVAAFYAEATTALANGDLDTAENIYAEIINAIPAESAAQIGLLRVQLLRGNVDMVKAAMAEVAPEVKAHKDFHALQSAVELAEQAADAGDTTELQAAVAAAPESDAARYNLANGLFAKGDVDGAFEQLFVILQRSRDWNDGAARAQLLKICETIGLEDARSRAARRRLSAILFT